MTDEEFVSKVIQFKKRVRRELSKLDGKYRVCCKRITTSYGIKIYCNSESWFMPLISPGCFEGNPPFIEEQLKNIIWRATSHTKRFNESKK
jgi:hypothetical protein